MADYRFKCVDCGKEYNKKEVDYICPACSEGQRPKHPLKGVLRVEYDYKELEKKFTVEHLRASKVRDQRRYFQLLPMESESFLPPIRVGVTPLENVERLREKVGLSHLYIKNDTLLPTGSIKDRASSVVVAKALEMGKKIVSVATTGNSGSALGSMAASVGMKNVVFAPSSSPSSKLVQIAMFGSFLVTVDGSYEDAYRLSWEAAEKYGWYNRNTGFNPYTIEGKKTAALEIWEQLDYRIPKKIFIPTGDGVILSSVYKGFLDLKRIGLVEDIPQLIPVQSVGASVIVDAVNNDRDTVEPQEKSSTVADSLSVASPACGNLALDILKETGSFGVKVDDDEIGKAEKELAALTGIFAEPGAAAAYAGLKKSVKEDKVEFDEDIVLMITGNGLKDIDAAKKYVDISKGIKPDLKSLDQKITDDYRTGE